MPPCWSTGSGTLTTSRAARSVCPCAPDTSTRAPPLPPPRPPVSSQRTVATGHPVRTRTPSASSSIASCRQAPFRTRYFSPCRHCFCSSTTSRSPTSDITAP